MATSIERVCQFAKMDVYVTWISSVAVEDLHTGRENAIETTVAAMESG